ncbi:MAG TPA: ATP-binding protein [Accumulibacter sp.]|jgi:PAS domain S-box-containing protein|nr:ATP-binding protein [Accumulibacter sp.]HQC79786.1 ATP-binding protein [Accumulibacter sp.]
MFDNLRKYAVAYLVAMGGVLMTCLSSWNVRQELQTSHLKEFQWAAGDRIQSVRMVVEQGLDALQEVRELYYATRTVDAKDFAVFSDSILKRRPYIHSLMWAPLVNRSTKPFATAGKNVPAPHFPVRLSASRADTDFPHGADFYAEKALNGLFERATASGAVAVSGRLALNRPGKPPVQVIYAALPVFEATAMPRDAPGRADSRAVPTGFVVGIYVIEELLHTAISMLEPRGVEVLVRDDSGGSDAQFLHHYASRLGSKVELADEPSPSILPGEEEARGMTMRIPVGDRVWAVSCVATNTFRSAEAFTKAHWSVLIGGILLTGLLSFYLALSRRELDKRMRLSQKIQEREEIFRQLAETVDVVFWAASADASRLEYIGPAFRQIAGSDARLDQRSLAQLFDAFGASDRRTLLAAVDQLLADGRRFNVVLPVTRGDRGLRWLRVCGFPVRKDGQELNRIVGFFEDITEHKLTDDALRDSESKLRTLFNHSPDLIFTVDRDATILLTNRHLPYPVGGAGAGEKRSELILPPDIRERYLEKLQQVFAKGRIEHYQYKASDATWWEIRIVPISSSQEVMAAMVVITDITENRKLQWQAIRSARLASLGVLSAGIAHEINNPNHAILANASLLARIWQDALPILKEYEEEQGSFLLAGLSFARASETISRGMTDIADNAKRIQRIIDNLKHLGKQDRGHMDELADIGKVLQAAATLLDSRIRKHTDCFTLDLQEVLPLVKGNIQQLEQVFINVIVNALESLPDRSRSVKVSARTAGGGKRVLVGVEDEGKGIADDVMANIGEPFLTTKAEHGGTGLGLSISSSIVERHGGMLRFESRGERGTRVSIDLPAAMEA